MEEKEKLLKEIQGLIADSQKENVKKSDLEARVESINAQLKALNEKPNNHEEIKALKDAVDKMSSNNDKLSTEMLHVAAEMKALKETPLRAVLEDKADPVEALTKAIMAGFVETGKNVPSFLKEVTHGERKSLSIKDYFTKLGNKHSPEIVVKIAVDMLESNINGNYVESRALTTPAGPMVGTPLSIYQHVSEWMPKKPIEKPTMYLLVAYTYVDGSGTKTEGSAPGQSSFLLKTVEYKSFVIGTYGTLSDEALDDLPEVIAEIARVFPSKVLDKVDSKILGTAGDDAADLAGLFTANKKTDFASATTYAESTRGANLVDVVAKMKLQGIKNKYPMNTVSINATDIERLTAEKDQLDNSKFDRRIAYNNIGEPVAICGMELKINEGQTANTVAVLDKNQLQIGDRKELIFEIGYSGDDFKENQKTVRVSVRLAFGVRDKAAVIYCSDWDTAMSAITKP